MADDDKPSGDVIQFEEAKRRRLVRPKPLTGTPPTPASPTGVLVAMVRANAALFADETGEPYAAVRVGNHREVVRLCSKSFRAWLDRLHFAKFDAMPSASVRTNALSILEGMTRYDAPRRPVHVRVGEHEGEAYVDLANDAWEAVKITGNGWEIVRNPPIRFRRSKGARPLARPVQGGSVEALLPFINVSKDAFYLLVAWLVGALRPRGPYPILVLQGEQGSGKSTTGRMLRSLVDPCRALLRSMPKAERDLAVAAASGWVVALDNMSGVTAQMSDALCRISTGGGLSTRAVYTDDDEHVLEFMRPVLVNGIDDIAIRPDLAERAMIVTLPTIAPDQRRDEARLWRDFIQASPGILGALLDAVVMARAHVNEVELTETPRMADFTRWVTAAEPALGWTRGTFVRLYQANRVEVDRDALDRDPLGAVIPRLPALRTTGHWSGPSTTLYAALCGLADASAKRSATWPRAAHALTARLKRLAPLLRSAGYEVSTHRTASERTTTITRTATEASRASPPSSNDEQAPCEGPSNDGGDAHDGD